MLNYQRVHINKSHTKTKVSSFQRLGGAIYSSSNSNPIHAISVISQLQPSHSSICWKDNFVPGSCPETRLPGGNLRSLRSTRPADFPSDFPGFPVTLWPIDHKINLSSMAGDGILNHSNHHADDLGMVPMGVCWSSPCQAAMSCWKSQSWSWIFNTHPN